MAGEQEPQGQPSGAEKLEQIGDKLGQFGAMLDQEGVSGFFKAAWSEAKKNPRGAFVTVLGTGLVVYGLLRRRNETPDSENPSQQH